MRNLKQYPITAEEVARTLHNELEKLQAAQLVGDTRPLVISYVMEYLASNDSEFSEFLKTKEI